MLKQTISTAALLAAALAAAPAPAQQATPTQAPATRTEIGPEGQVIVIRPALPRYFMDRESVHDMAGTYLMEDGTQARIKDRNRKLVVDYDDRSTVLEAIGPNLFASSNDDMRLQFKQDDFGDDTIVLSYVPARRVAAVTTYGSSRAD